MGNKQSEKFFGYYSLWGSHSMDKSLANTDFIGTTSPMFYDTFAF
jgi:hypothetical protein